MASIYVAPFDNLSLTAATDLIHLTAPTDNATPIILMEFNLFQTSDLGDASEEVLRIGLFRGVTGGSGGTALTEVPVSAGDGSTTTVGLANNTSASTGGTQIDEFGWNVRIPLLWCPIPELRPIVTSASDPIVFRLLAAPADALSIGGSIKWQEIK